jgi:hypothetical protein
MTTGTRPCNRHTCTVKRSTYGLQLGVDVDTSIGQSRGEKFRHLLLHSLEHSMGGECFEKSHRTRSSGIVEASEDFKG